MRAFANFEIEFSLLSFLCTNSLKALVYDATILVDLQHAVVLLYYWVGGCSDMPHLQRFYFRLRRWCCMSIFDQNCRKCSWIGCWHCWCNWAQQQWLAVGGREKDLQVWDPATQQLVFAAKNLPHDELRLRRCADARSARSPTTSGPNTVSIEARG